MTMYRPNVANCGFCKRNLTVAKRIAIIEDERAIRDNYAAAFRREGYAVDTFEARAPALNAFETRLPDLVVIDVNLKDDVEGGFELCRDLRARSTDLPIIFLTARDSEFDAVSGLRRRTDTDGVLVGARNGALSRARQESPTIDGRCTSRA